MKTLITIAGTLLAGATPFTFAALGNEAATTAAVQEQEQAVTLRRSVERTAQDPEAQELEELRRAIAELRAEKDQLRAELDAQRTSGLWPEKLHEDLLLEWTEHAYSGSDSGEERELHRAQAVIEELARVQYEEARKHAQEFDRSAAESEQRLIVRDLEESIADLQRANSDLELDLLALESEEGVLLEVRPRIAEAQQRLREERADLERRYLVALRGENPEQPGAIARLLESDHLAKITQEEVEVLLKELGSQDAAEAPQRRVRRFVVDGKTLELEGDALPEGLHERHVIIHRDGDRRFGTVAIDPATEPHEVQVEENVWFEVGGDGDQHRVRVAPRAPHGRTFIRDFQDGDVEPRVFSEKRVFVRGADGELFEVDVAPLAPPSPAAPRVSGIPGAPSAPSAPAAPRAALGLGGAPSPAPAPERKAIRWSTTGSVPAAPSTDSRAGGRDELLREVHVLTKEMLAELRLLRAAVDELRRDVDAHHDSRPRTGAR